MAQRIADGLQRLRRSGEFERRYLAWKKLVLKDLELLNGLFAPVITPTGGSTVTEENGVATIGGTAPTASLTDEQLKAISEATATIRASYIN